MREHVSVNKRLLGPANSTVITEITPDFSEYRLFSLSFSHFSGIFRQDWINAVWINVFRIGLVIEPKNHYQQHFPYLLNFFTKFNDNPIIFSYYNLTLFNHFYLFFSSFIWSIKSISKALSQESKHESENIEALPMQNSEKI